MQHIVAEFETRTGRRAAESTIVEIGFGARPEMAFAMTAFFKKVVAIDLDAPLLSMADLPAIFRKNGLERGLKSACRHLLFDTRGWKAFHRTLKGKLSGYNPDRVNFVIGNAGTESTWENIGQVDLIFSQDVFEHIAINDLRLVMAEIRKHIAPGGFVMTTPNVYTGIGGGHDTKWYFHRVDLNRSAGAWGHLMDSNFKTNTYLNKMTRREYCALFEETGFKVLRDEQLLGRVGEKHLTEEKRKALSAYDDYELFSNRVKFWLEPA
jgi:SAM-dependent methyltransferase